jgi:hypothetical protein
MKDKMAKLRAMKGKGMEGCGDKPKRKREAPTPIPFPQFNPQENLTPSGQVMTSIPPSNIIRPTPRRPQPPPPQGSGMMGKGSQYMKDKMAKLREMRGKK